MPVGVGDKHDRGTVLVVGGSSATVGAVVLAGRAALRMGAGRLQLAVGEAASSHLGVVVPEAKVVGLPERADGTLRPRRSLERIGELVACADAVLLGPGLAGGTSATRLLSLVLGAIGPACRVVLDAAALDAAADIGRDVLEPVAGRIALTPNRAELAHLLTGHDLEVSGDVTVDVAAAAASYAATVTSFSAIADADGRCWRAPDGGPTLATSGSGDVLAGLVAGGAARTDGVAAAVCWATYVHAQAAIERRHSCGAFSVLASDLVDAVPGVLCRIERG